MADLNKESMAIWKSLKPMIDEEIKAQTRGSVQRRKMKVTTAPSLVTNVIGVTEPYGTEMLIPFNTNLSTAHIGDVVWVEFMYGATNAFASMYASADTKDWTVGGDANIIGNATINGVLDVTKRRCSATLSSAGWYRVLKHTGAMPDGAIIKFLIGRNVAGECHTIDLNVPYGYTFVNEVSSSDTNFGITKIRVTSDSEYRYVDVYYALSATCTLRVDFVAAGTLVQSKVVAESLQSVADAPSGETVRATYEFVDHVPYYGTNSTGSYQMFSDGTLICWVNVTLSNVAITSSWGGIYESSWLGLGDWPKAFVSMPTISLIQDYSGSSQAAMLEAVRLTSATYVGQACFWRPNSATVTTVKYKIVGIGRWK